MSRYEMEKQETVGNHPNGNLAVRGQCVFSVVYQKEQEIRCDLVYIGPPFASGADYGKKVYICWNPKKAQAIAQAEQELYIEELKDFEEKCTVISGTRY